MIELLVATAVTNLLVIVLVGISQGVLSNYKQLRSGSNIEREAGYALDVLSADLESLLVPGGPDREALRITFEPVGDRSMPWLTFLALANDADAGGNNQAPRAVSYRVGFQDPVPGSDDNERFGLYRAVASAQDTFETAVLAADPQADFWTDARPTTDWFDLLADRILDFQIRLRRDDNGEWIEAGENNTPVRIAGTGVETNGTPVPGRISAIEVAVTVLSEQGESLLRDGSISPELARQRFSKTYVRQTAVLGRGF